jgi:FKBP-type peptidyl-prolyl cis-trans isomerase
MKKLVVVLMMGSGLMAFGQAKKPAAKPSASKPSASKPATTTALKTLNDSASYAIGISVANFYKQQGITNINTALVTKAINDVMVKKSPLLNDQQANSVMMSVINQAQESKAKVNISSGAKFLAQNKSKPGIKTTASGLQYEVLKEGSGPKPAASDTVTVNYVGTLINGTEFDNSYKRGEPITFPVSGVIKGWTEALQLMSKGAKYKLYIPHDLAYGVNEVGSIPAGSVLIFEVDLLDIPSKK